MLDKLQKKYTTETLGDCFKVAGDMLIKHGREGLLFGTLYLVHAEIAGYGPIKGLRHAHAWVEDEMLVYDFSNDNRLYAPKEVYYNMAQPDTGNPKKYRRYTYDEATELMLKSGNYGYWDIETEC